ncbi:UNVERIFIED_CONTAM: hypothetical protein HDU68_000443 [Siphonaria sp. JEL0065]|nr:hypothetical protein HDU68_000443 [Siphonaria sp. JEL0065]
MSSTTTIEPNAADTFAFSQTGNVCTPYVLTALPPAANQMLAPPFHYNQDYEDVSTIFVIGFPEDIQEREFRNLFTFAPGFESSALKYPSSFDSEEGLVMYKKTVIGFAKFRSRSEANYARDFLNGRQVDTDRGCIIKAEIAKRNLHFKRTASGPGMNGVLAPVEFIPQYTLEPTPLFVGGLSSESTSPTLLETNQMRSSSSSSLDSSFLDYSSLNSPVPWDILNDEASAVKPSTITSNAGFKGITDKSSLRIDTSSLRIDTDVPTLLHIGSSDNTEKNMTTCRNSPTGLDNEPLEILTRPIPCSSAGGSLISSRSGSLAGYEGQQSGEDGSSNASFVNRLAARMNSVASDRGFSSALFSSDSLWASSTTSTTNTSSTSLKMNGGIGMMHHNNGMINAMYTNSLGGMSQQQQLAYVNGTSYNNSANGCNSLGMNGNGTGSAFNVSLPTPASIAAAGYRCPADQNPPCNTLYVGNLPTNTCEAELRELFSRCLGYRRMSFRMRVNGPMVFVEFDSIPYAQQALNDLHGTLLSNSIKGGIRLSFSKNPLGVRPTGPMQMGGNSNGWGLSGLLSPMAGFFGGEMMV